METFVISTTIQPEELNLLWLPWPPTKAHTHTHTPTHTETHTHKQKTSATRWSSQVILLWINPKRTHRGINNHTTASASNLNPSSNIKTGLGTHLHADTHTETHTHTHTHLHADTHTDTHTHLDAHTNTHGAFHALIIVQLWNINTNISPLSCYETLRILFRLIHALDAHPLFMWPKPSL